jgi:hypothetical protein
MHEPGSHDILVVDIRGKMAHVTGELVHPGHRNWP